MKLKIPPPIYFALTALVMWLIPRNTNFMEFAFPGQAILALLLAVGGIAVGAMALAHFSKAKTTFHPTDPEKTTVIVDSGVYAISRKPDVSWPRHGPCRHCNLFRRAVEYGSADRLHLDYHGDADQAGRRHSAKKLR